MTDHKIKINWKNGVLWFALIQIEIIAVSFLLGGIINIIVGFFVDTGPAKDIVLFMALLFVEMMIKFFIFFASFQNNRNFTFKQFCLDYTLTFVLRFIISIIFRFYTFAAGASLSLSGALLAGAFTSEEIVSPDQVPIIYFISLFVLMELITILVSFTANKLSITLKKKLKKSLHKE